MHFKFGLFLLCCFLLFSLQSNAEFIPIPKRKKQLNTTIDKPRQIIEMKENAKDEFLPIPRRKKENKSIQTITRKKRSKKNGSLAVTDIIDMIRNKLTKCWNIPAHIAHEESFNVKIELLLSPQGEIITADIVDNHSYQDNALFKSLSKSAMRAVHKCSPFNNLPSEHYHIWRNVILDFILNGR
ncbi:MAG: hypothetical protein QWI36_01380 [Wolbachia endosymbiont of Tyrophagus putrescentiae]|nr:hypothetical protein [Wolbachia endosymbiont of Tyrophagus putrescentiae]